MDDTKEELFVKDFQEAIWRNPIVHNYMSLMMQNNLNYIETLKHIIVDLVNTNHKLEEMLTYELTNKPSPLITERLIGWK